MKEIIKSVLIYGSKSKVFKIFYDICHKIAISYLSINKNKQFKDYLLKNMDYSINDLARDLIDPLFETKGKKFVQFENYFNKKYPNGIERIDDDELKASLSILIISKINQQISVLREDLGEIYFKVKKAVNKHINLNKHLFNFKKINDKVYLTRNHKDCVINENIDIPVHHILDQLFYKKFKTAQVPEIIDSIFDIIENDSDFYPAITQEKIIEIVNSYFKTRFQFVNLENVEYNIYDE